MEYNMRYPKDADGWYTRDLLNGDTFKTRICPTDGTSPTAWAQTLIQKAQDVIDHGFGLCSNGEPYDLSNFMCDVHGGSVPWNPVMYKTVYEEMQKLPNFIQVLDDFFKKYGDVYFYKTWAENERACEGFEVEYLLT